MKPFKALFSRSSQHNRQAKPARTRLGLESLDDRCLPGAISLSVGIKLFEAPQIVGAHIGMSVAAPDIVGNHAGTNVAVPHIVGEHVGT
jgi:hypothetical protein